MVQLLSAYFGSLVLQGCNFPENFRNFEITLISISFFFKLNRNLLTTLCLSIYFFVFTIGFFFLSKPMLLSICLFYLVVSCDFLFKFPNIFQRLSIYSIFYSKLLLFHVELFDITMQQSICFVSKT